VPRGNRIEFQTDRTRLIEVARGERSADLWIVGGKVVNVYSGEILDANVAICGDRIAYVGPRAPKGREATQAIDASGQYVVPGLIEPHSHPWVVYNPVSLTEVVLPLGTTTMVHDNLFFFLRLGADGFRRMLNDLRGLPGLHLWLARVVSQAEYEGEREAFRAETVQALLEWPEVAGTAEITRWPILYEGDGWALDTIEAARRLGKVSDGHTSGASYERLNAVVAAGISACHEAITAGEVLDRLRLGLWTVLRDSSLRPDLAELIRAITEYGVDTRRICMTVDGPNPVFIADHGFVDGLVRRAIAAGVSPVQAIQLATINPATCLGLDDAIGGIAPGRRADVLLVEDFAEFRPRLVISAGRVVARDGNLCVPLPNVDWLQYQTEPLLQVSPLQLQDPALYTLRASDVVATAGMVRSVPVPVVRFRSAVITERVDRELRVRDGVVSLDDSPDVTYAALVDSSGQWVTRALLENFVPAVDGMATTYNTTTHLLTVGRRPQSMARAAMCVREMRGGVALVQGDTVTYAAALPFTGMMTTDNRFETALAIARDVGEAVRAAGYPFHDILYSLLFLTCDFLPGPRITPRGVVDVKTRRVLIPPQRLVTHQPR
jgi:adenine deaminase